jgi:membrane-bound lytic murein transglycosylase A
MRAAMLHSSTHSHGDNVVPADPNAGTGYLPVLQPVRFGDLPGFADDDHVAVFAVFAQHAALILEDRAALRPAVPADEALRSVCRRALTHPPSTQMEARAFFEENFLPHRVLPDAASDNTQPVAGRGFVTGYYEPVVEGSLTPTAAFTVPLFGRPDDLITLAAGESAPGLAPELSAARRLPDGAYGPYPERAAIEAGALADHAKPLIWLRDKVEAFFVQVQGSARAVLPDGRKLRLVYAGRNGHPYTSIGRILVDTGEIPATDMGMVRVKQWIRSRGQGPGEAGSALMLRNKSYVFFAQKDDLADAEGPIGGAGISLARLRSIAVDRRIWCYGLPFWLDTSIPWQDRNLSPFRRLMIAGDTGSAIVGSARADIFFGGGAVAAEFAGNIRHTCDFTVLLPKPLRSGDGIR